MSNKATRRANGFRDTLLWLSPDAVAALKQLRRLHPGQSASVIVSNLLVASASTSSGHVARADPVDQTAAGGSISGSILGSIPGGAGVDGGPDGPGFAKLAAEVAEVRARMTSLDDSQVSLMFDWARLADRMDLLESRLEKVAGPAAAPAVLTPEMPVKGTPVADNDFKGDHKLMFDALVAATVNHGNWGFNMSEVYRELKDRGVSVPAHSKNFCSWATRHRKSIEAAAAKAGCWF